MEKIKKFAAEHKLLITGIILYILMYIVSQNFNPWQSGSTEVKMASGMTYNRPETDVLSLYMPYLDIKNRILDKIPLTILYFGVSDIAEAVHNSISFLFALITYSSIAMGYFMDKYYSKHQNIKKFEKWIIAHLYDNVLFYIVSIAIRFLQPTADYIIDNMDKFFPWLDKTFKANIGLKLLSVVILLLTAVLVLLLILLPMLPSVLYFFGYTAALIGIQRIIELADAKFFGKIFGDTLFPREFLTFIAAFLLIMLMNIIIEQIYELIQDLSLKPVCFAVNGIRTGISGLTRKFRRN